MSGETDATSALLFSVHKVGLYKCVDSPWPIA
jgi:hypothetical protein